MNGLRLAGAPISWGVCEVPGWGFQLPPTRVLTEMRDLGLSATEFGPDGFLPAEPAAKAALLKKYGLAAVGGFVPVVLHEAHHDPLPEIARAIDGFVAAGAEVLVLAAATGATGYDSRPRLDGGAWRTLAAHLDRAVEYADGRGVRATLHPHVGTVVERPEEVQRVLDTSSAPLCLDTGHLLIGGSDPAELARTAADRVAHVHLKDVDEAWAARVRGGEVTYTEAVSRGMYRPLGRGDVDVADIVGTLNDAGYTGWFVLEQDTVLSGPPGDDGPASDVRASIGFLRGLG